MLFLTRGSNSVFSLLSLFLGGVFFSLFFSLPSFVLSSQLFLIFFFYVTIERAGIFGPSWLRFVDVGAVLFRVSSGQLTKQGIGLFAPSVPRLAKLIPGQRHAVPSPWALRLWHSLHPSLVELEALCVALGQTLPRSRPVGLRRRGVTVRR